MVSRAQFEDGALMQTFGRSGFGLFPAPAVLAPDIAEQFGARPLARVIQEHIKKPLADEVLEAFAAFGEKGAAAPVRGSEPSHTGQNGIYGAYARVPGAFHNDGGTAARFFFSAKASRAERGVRHAVARVES